MIELNIVQQLNEITETLERDNLNKEWAKFIDNVQSSLLNAAKQGDKRLVCEFRHFINVNRATQLFVAVGLRVGQDSINKPGIIYATWIS